MIDDVEKCIDHPENIGVEVCRVCGKTICGFHDTAYCVTHQPQSDPPISLKIYLVVFSIAFTFVVMFIVSTFIESLLAFDGLQPGDVVTVDSEVITVTEEVIIPDVGTMFVVFFSVAIPILSVIAFFLIRWSRQAREPALEIVPAYELRTEPTLFFCQQCGTELNTTHLVCTNCGKSTDDERKLLK